MINAREVPGALSLSSRKPTTELSKWGLVLPWEDEPKAEEGR